jgi:tRNA A-37 threonylcarbamoyl transferase component Bud32
MADEPGRAEPPAGAPDPRIGRVLQDRYRITGAIASGGMGIVYRAERLGLGRVVAIKFLHASMARDPQITRRFEIEAQAMSRLAHPNCIGVLDFGVDDLPYVVIDYVEGAPLDAAVKAGPVPARRALRIVRQILSALAHAHAHGIVHRDIKPENVVLERTQGLEDHVRILDFGLAKLMGSDFGLTVGVAVGTPHYMAPEQMSEAPIDGRADLYAVGIVLYELLTGQKPFDGPEVGDVLLRHIGAPPPKLRETMPGAGFSAPLEALILRAMAKKPGERFASAEAMTAALDELPEMVGTPGPEVMAPQLPTGAAAHARDATVPWSSAAALALAMRASPGTLGPEVPPAPPTERTPSALGREGRAAPSPEHPWRAWLSARPFWLAVATGLGAAMLAGAMVMVGFSGRPAGESSAAAATAEQAKDEAMAQGTAAPAGQAGQRRQAKKQDGDGDARPVATDELKGRAARGRTLASAETTVREPTARTRAIEPPRREIRSAAEAVAQGQKLFTQERPGAGLAAFRQAIKLEPRRRSDAVVLKTVIAGLADDKRGECAAFLRELGDAAQPALREAARNHPIGRVRVRAAELLPPVVPKRKPFLRWL